MARSLSAAEHQDHGRQLFKAGSYEKALLQFTSALEKCEDVSLSILDNRASTLEKLCRFDDAVRDGTRMIQLDKRDVRGYLRTGRVLQRSEDPSKRDLALKIYAKGLRRVPASHEHYQTLQAMHCKLTRAMAPLKSIDPFTILPPELVYMILDYLEFHHWVRCVAVSRKWKYFLADRPELWCNIDFSTARRAVSTETINRYLNRGRHHIRSFTFHRYSNPNGLMGLLTAAPHLESLMFCVTEYGTQSIVRAFLTSALARHRPSCDWLQTLSLGKHTPVSLDGVTQIMRHCSGLVNAHFDGIETHSSGLDVRATWTGLLPSLKELRFRSLFTHPSDTDKWHLAQLFKQTPNLKSLHIVDPRGVIDLVEPKLPPLESLDLTGAIRLPREMPPTLQELRLHTRMLTSSWPWPQLAPLTDLREVEASGICADEVMLQLQRGYDVLPWQHLDLNIMESQWLDASHMRALPRSFRRCPDLQELGMHGNLVGDEYCQQLAEMVPQLRRVNVAYTAISGVGIKTLVLVMKDLTFLDVSHCAKLNIDAVEWARAKGLKVKHSMPAEGRYGKKIRHG